MMRAGAALLLVLAARPALAGEVAASPPRDLSVTVYRAPQRNGGTIRLGSLGGFAVITETRTVALPAGESELRFEGVVDGIVPESAIVAGLPGGVIEKNRDAALLSPTALARAAVGKALTLKRTDRATGKVTQVPATLVSAGPDGVVFQTAAGTEALRCSGLPETFRYSAGVQGLSARPTLSVRTRSARALTATVTLTYIAEDFDWSAAYTARVAPDGATLDLGGWITLANGNTVSLANARTQIVAGGLNRAYLRRYLSPQPQVVARCWPLQTTSDIPEREGRPYQLVRPYGGDRDGLADIVVTAQRKGGVMYEMAVSAPMAVMAPPPPVAEQLGDLKLYRVPQRTTVAAQQMKQTRLLDQPGVPVERVYLADLTAGGQRTVQARAVLRTRNDKAHKLGLPLPAGAFTIEQDHGGRAMLVGQPVLRDTAEGEKIELALGPAPDVTVTQRTATRGAQGSSTEEVEVANANDRPVTVELTLRLYGTVKIARADPPVTREDGLPVIRLTVPANGTARASYTVASN